MCKKCGNLGHDWESKKCNCPCTKLDRTGKYNLDPSRAPNFLPYCPMCSHDVNKE
jgi:hypothetical protein